MKISSSKFIHQQNSFDQTDIQRYEFIEIECLETTGVSHALWGYRGKEGVQVGWVGRLDVHYADEKGERGRCCIIK